MNFRNIVDLHTHTDHSFDGHYPVGVLCEESVKNGIKTVAFTDHLEMDVFYKDNFDKTAAEAFEDISKAKELYEGRLEVCVGAEFGEAAYVKELSEEIGAKYDYDIIIGAIHNLPEKDDFYYMDFSGDMDFYPLLDEYFDWELKMAQWAKFDTLAHLTYPLRYIVGNYGRKVDMSRYSEIIDEILLSLIGNKTALELNTAGYRQPIGIPSPDESILRRYKELGGKLLTLGSDAHYTEHMGADICRGYELALKCGFDKVTVFRKREPVLIPIE